MSQLVEPDKEANPDNQQGDHPDGKDPSRVTSFPTNNTSPLALVSVMDVVKHFPQSKGAALNGISFEVGQGEFVALLGPSGSGKTTTLRCIAGLETVTDGEIRLCGQVVSSPKVTVPPADRNLGMVFQSYALWPHMNVFENVAYPLKIQQVRRDAVMNRVNELLDLLGLPDKKVMFPHQLSGGQQQRVALARALVAEPSLILFDEPLSNLDARLRDSMRILIRDLTRKLGVAALYVTHDRLDALVMADRIIVMDGGVVIQHGQPQEIYKKPRNTFVAQFLGDVNVYRGTIVRVESNLVTVDLAIGTTPMVALVERMDRQVVGTPVRILVRPNEIRLTSPGDGGFNRLSGMLERAIFLGETWKYRVGIPGGTDQLTLEILATEHLEREVGQSVDVFIAHEHVVLLPDPDVDEPKLSE